MTIIDDKLIREIQEMLNVPDAEEYQYKSDLIKALFNELLSISEKYHQFGKVRGHGSENVATAMFNLKSAAGNKKKELIKAIEDFRKNEEETALRDHQKKSSDKQISLAEEANRVATDANAISVEANRAAHQSLEASKEANRISKASAQTSNWSFWVSFASAVIAAGAVAMSYFNDHDVEKIVTLTVNEKMNDQFISELAERVEKNLETKGLSNTIANQVKSEVTTYVDLELKPKIVAEVENQVRSKKGSPKKVKKK
jgi:hypothetical protein